MQEDWAFWRLYREGRAFLREGRALLREGRALLREDRARLIVYMTIGHQLLDPSSYFAEVFYHHERWGAGVETQKNVLGVFGGWGRVPFNEPYAPSLSTIYDGA